MPLSQSETSDEGSYDVPETFLNLDEIAAPPPLIPRRHDGFVFFPERKGPSQPSSQPEDTPADAPGPEPSTPSVAASSLGEKITSLPHVPRRDSWGNLTTVTEAPTPVAGRSARQSRASRRQSRREDRSSESPAAEEKEDTVNSSIWQSARRKRITKLMTVLYTLAYLVLFSILGTLARLGLQALTVYPGAPVTTPVVWANLAGSLILGFLAEDRALFREEWGASHAARQRHLEWLREKRTLRRQERDLLKRSTRYSETQPAPRPFTSPTTAQLYPHMRVYKSMPASRSEPSVVTESTAPVDRAEEKQRHNAVKKTIPLYIGVATGFCGSFTSFSSFMRDAFLALANSPLPYSATLSSFTTVATSRNGGFSFLALLGVCISEPALSLAGYYTGAHLALALEPSLPTLPYRLIRKVFDPLALVLGFGAWIGAIILCILPADRPAGPAAGPASTWATETWRGSVLFAVALAPLGCILRFYVSILLNPRRPSFPLGTFAVNVVGSALEAALFALQHAGLGAAGVGGGRVGCQILQGAMDGFCGCLTTVSTWVAELNGLRRAQAWVYALASVAGGLMAMVVIVGPVRWGHGLEATACGF